MKYVLGSLLVISFGLQATNFVVNNTADAGAGSLRQAITDANLAAGPHMISFAIPGIAPHLITVNSALPPLNQQITVDGTSQPGYAGTPVVILNGANLPINAGLEPAFSGVVVKGLKIVGFERAILVSVTDHVTVTFNELTGNLQGVQLNNATENTITKNTISENSDTGIFVFNTSTLNNITQNIIDVNRNGGIFFDATSTDNIVKENTITDNGGFGVQALALNNAILTNSIFNNVLSGIVNGGFPLVTVMFTQVNYQVIANVPTISIQGTVQGQPSAPFRLQFFENTVNRAPITEGQLFLGELNDVGLDANGQATFFARFDLVDPINLPSFISATATEQLLGPIIPDKTTSEFTQNYPILSFESPISLAVKAKYCS